MVLENRELDGKGHGEQGARQLEFTRARGLRAAKLRGASRTRLLIALSLSLRLLASRVIEPRRLFAVLTRAAALVAFIRAPTFSRPVCASFFPRSTRARPRAGRVPAGGSWGGGGVYRRGCSAAADSRRACSSALFAASLRSCFPRAPLRPCLRSAPSDRARASRRAAARATHVRVVIFPSFIRLSSSLFSPLLFLSLLSPSSVCARCACLLSRRHGISADWCIIPIARPFPRVARTARDRPSVR